MSCVSSVSAATGLLCLLSLRYQHSADFHTNAISLKRTPSGIYRHHKMQGTFEQEGRLFPEINAPDLQTLQSGTTDTVQCQADPSDPLFSSPRWRDINWNPILEGGRYKLTSKGLTISNISDTDNGLYVCEFNQTFPHPQIHDLTYQIIISVKVV